MPASSQPSWSPMDSSRAGDLHAITQELAPELDNVRLLTRDRLYRDETFRELIWSSREASSATIDFLPAWILEGTRSPSPTNPSDPNRMTDHLLLHSGKYFRATLVLSTMEAFGARQHPRGCHLAAAMELIHLATLLHDDVIDHADLRRGVASVASLFGETPAVLMGDHLFARAFELISECGNLALIHSACRATSAMCRGEVEQLQWIGDLNIPLDIYLRLIEMKTAALMASGVENAAILSGYPEYAPDCYHFGILLGLVFQITDDLLDFVAEEKRFGKKVGGDVQEGKYTLPLILLREKLGGAEGLKKFLQDHPDPTRLGYELDKAGILPLVHERIASLVQCSHQVLDHLEEKSNRPGCFERLHRLVEFVADRDH